MGINSGRCDVGGSSTASSHTAAIAILDPCSWLRFIAWTSHVVLSVILPLFLFFLLCIAIFMHILHVVSVVVVVAILDLSVDVGVAAVIPVASVVSLVTAMVAVVQRVVGWTGSGC